MKCYIYKQQSIDCQLPGVNSSDNSISCSLKMSKSKLHGTGDTKEYCEIKFHDMLNMIIRKEWYEIFLLSLFTKFTLTCYYQKHSRFDLKSISNVVIAT